MSAQSVNSTTYRGFYLGSVGGNIGPFPLRNASDYTTLQKQQGTRRMIGTFGVTGTTNIPYNIVQSNDSRIDYQFGAIGCTGCTFSFPSNLAFGR